MLKNIIVCFLILMPVCAGAKENLENAINIRGMVLSANGNPLPGANVIIMNTAYGSTSDNDGNYVLKVSSKEHNKEITLQVSFVGYTPQSVTLTLSSDTIRQDFRLMENALMLRKIEVTAQKRRENLQKVPISISAIDSRTIEQRGAARLLELEYAVPNLNFRASQGEHFTGIAIRGISDFSRNIGYESRAGVYVDGVFAGRSVAFNQDLLDLEQVEVLRGPPV
jgi:outer membrane receptor for monomeric catechols